MQFVKKGAPESIIEVIAFNYDGQGGALYRYIDSSSVEDCSLEELQNMLLGNTGVEAEYEILDSN